MNPEELALVIDSLESHARTLYSEIRLYTLPVHEEAKKIMCDKAGKCQRLADKLRRKGKK